MSERVEILAGREDERSSPPGEPPYPRMVWIPGGPFQMGSDEHYPEEAPAHEVRVEGPRF